MRRLDARYENGFLKPSEPLPLRPGECVSLIVVRRADPNRWNLDRLAMRPEEDRAFAEQGLADWAEKLDGEDRS